MEINELKFDEKGLIPAIIQDFNTEQVLMMAYMNEESLRRTLETGTTWYWSRSRQEFWNKGATSGNKQFVKEIKYDCDKDTLLIQVDQIGVACHTGARSCFNETIGKKAEAKPFYSTIDIGRTTMLEEFYDVILAKRELAPEQSATAALFAEGRDGIVAKVEEKLEKVVKDVKTDNKSEIVMDFADLFYHMLVLMASSDIQLSDIEAELDNRRG